MCGEPEGEYEYVGADHPDGVSNYVLGRRLCAGLVGRLEKAAQHWWHSYAREGKPKPNCWRKHADCPDRVRDSVPRDIVEVSLYDLLRDHFSTDMDAQKAELELERFVWKPFDKEKGMDMVVFRDHVERLLWRAGIMGDERKFQRIRAIRNCLPPKFKEVVHMVKTENQLWEAIEVAYSTAGVDYIEKQCTGCGKTGHTVDLCRAKKDKPADTVKSADEKRGGKQCFHCKKTGHIEKDCWAKHGRPGQGKPASDKAAAATTATAAAAAPAAGSGNKQANSGTRTCFRYGKEGHMVRHCPDVAPVSFVQQQRGGDGTAFYTIPHITPTVDFRPPARKLGKSQHLSGIVREIDTKEVVLGGDDRPLPLHYALAQTYVEK